MKVEINENLFKQMIDSVKHCVSKEQYRPILQYIQIKVKGDTVTAYTLDGYRAAKTQIKLKEPNNDEFICFIKPLPFKPSKRGINNVVIENDGNSTFVEVITEYGKIKYHFDKPDGEFDIEKVYSDNKAHDRELGAQTGYIVQACRALNAVADRYNTVVLETKECNTQPFIIRAHGDGIVSEQLILPMRISEEYINQYKSLKGD